MIPGARNVSAPSPPTGLAHPRRVLHPFLFGALVIVWLGFFFLHPPALTKVGVGHYRIEVAPERFHEMWFLDTLAILASNDAAALGEDPYVPNRLDYLRRPHVYGPAWLQLRHLGLTRAHVQVIGLTLAAVFVLTAAVLMRPHDLRSLGWCLALFCTTPVLAAIERGNNDLVVFVMLAPVVPLLLSERPLARWLAVPLVAFAAALKYYPAVAGLVLLARAPGREVRWRLGGAFLCFALAGWQVIANVPASVPLPEPGGILSFGAVGLFRHFGLQGKGPQLFVLMVAVVAFVGWWRSRWLRGWEPGPSQRREWLYFILGGVLLTGCFFVGQHFAYRWIFAIFMAPMLWVLPRDPQAPSGVRRLARATGWLLILMLWAEALFVFAVHRWPHDDMMRAADRMWFVMQPLTWAFFLCVLGFLAHFTRTAWAELTGSRVNGRAMPVAA